MEKKQPMRYDEIVADCAKGIALFENCPEPLDFNAECRILVMNVLWARTIRLRHEELTRDEHAFIVLLLHEMQEAIRPRIIDRGKFSAMLEPLIHALDKVILDFYYADGELSGEMVAEFYRLIQSPMWRNRNPEPSPEFREALEKSLLGVAETCFETEGVE